MPGANRQQLNFIPQKTLKSAIGCSGVGLHSGKAARMTLAPAEAGTGVVLRRLDRDGATVAATYENICSTTMCTSIGNGSGVHVATVEHLMSALLGLGVDNVVVELDGPEVPIMDGSAAPFVFLIECAGLVEQPAPRKAIQVLKTVEISDGERYVSLSPADQFSVSIEITYEHPAIGRQECYFELADGAFKRELCRARTFGFLRDVPGLRARGFALGGTIENAVVLSDDAVINEEGLRYEDEFVRHKALDCVGDLYLAGAPILGHMRGVSSGHSMNHKLLEALFADDTAWRSVTLDNAAFAAFGWSGAPVAASA